jgi:hypothetical protein
MVAVRGRIGRRLEVALDLFAGEVDQDHVAGREILVGHAAGLDRENALVAIEGGGVAEGQVDEAMLQQGHVGFVGFAFEVVEHGGACRKRYRALLVDARVRRDHSGLSVQR